MRFPARGQQQDAADSTRWNARPLVALGLRLVMAGVPAVAAVLVALFIEKVSPPAPNWPSKIISWALLLGVCTIVSLVVERRMRSLLPLALLMRMTLAFPDQAPSRYAVARAANSPAKIRELATAGQSPRSHAAAEVLALVARLAKHDRHTRGHSERVRVFTDLIAEQLGVSGADRDKLAWGALLHDIGKMTVPGELLNKAGKPTPKEWEVLKGHPDAGGAFAADLAGWLGPWIGGITEHHERFDGKGYPRGLAEQDITLAGRIVAVADAYETMTAARSYKKPMSVAVARQELTNCAGAHFDPVVVRAFLAVSLPRLMWGVGPLSFLAHLPFVVRAEALSVQLAAASSAAAAPAAAAAAVGAASVVTAGAVVPATNPPVPARVSVADTVAGNSSTTPSGGSGGAQVSPTALPTSSTISRPVSTANGSTAGSATTTAAGKGGTKGTTSGTGASNNGNGSSGNSGNSGSSNSANGNTGSGSNSGSTSGGSNGNSGSNSSGSTNSSKGGSGSNSGNKSSGTVTTSPAPSTSAKGNSPKTTVGGSNTGGSGGGTSKGAKATPTP